jgi:hypothetical protein
MVMRYHWGVAVGHIYTDYASPTTSSAIIMSPHSPKNAEEDLDTHFASSSGQDNHDMADMAEDEPSSTRNLEFSLDDLEDVDLEYGEESDWDDERDPSDDETFMDMAEMYP